MHLSSNPVSTQNDLEYKNISKPNCQFVILTLYDYLPMRVLFRTLKLTVIITDLNFNYEVFKISRKELKIM